MKNINDYTKDEIVDTFVRGIIYLKKINPDGKELVCVYGSFSDLNNYEAIHRFVADNLDKIRESSSSTYFEDHFDLLVDRIRAKLDIYQY